MSGHNCGCGCNGAPGGCGGHHGATTGPQPAAEPWWDPRSAPDAATSQVGTRSHIASLFAGVAAPNTGFQGPYRPWFTADVPAATVDLVHANPQTVRGVPPDQTTLITPRNPR